MEKFLSGVKKLLTFLKFALLPVLVGVYPVLFHYANNLGNLGILPFSQLGDLFMLLILIALAIYLAFYVIYRGRSTVASLSGFTFVIFFNLYGLLYSWLLGKDFVAVDHYLFFPFYTLLAIYLAWISGKLLARKNANLSWNIFMLILCSLIAFNGVKIVGYEIKKAEADRSQAAATTANSNAAQGQDAPDIYYFIFDEFAGFDAMRNYWKNDQVDSLVQFLKDDGFYVAEDSHSGAPSTLFELASRLNYASTFSSTEDNEIFYQAISHNQVMQYLKSRGYTTVTFDGLYYAWPYRQQIIADVAKQPAEAYTGGFLNYEFDILVLKNTMVLPFLYNEKQDDPLAVRNRSMIFYTVDNITKLSDIPGPKFVFVHMMAPHSPFLFAADGEPLDPQHYRDWNYYLGNYIYTTRVIQELVGSLMSAADPAHPPVIILQSDHGARNGKDDYINVMKNYPPAYRNLIMDALYLPGCNTTDLVQNVNPINTFPIVFNCYFNAGIPLK